MRFFTKERQGGSVTVILTMVLVPMVVIAGIFVDGGRGHLARSVVRSAEQLALNNVLAQHDDELQSLYGLLAVIDDENLDSAANEILRASTSGGEGGDILQVVAGVDGGVTVSPVAQANLAQSEVLTNQMVEFMKYRAPASFLEDLLGSLQWLKTLKTGMEMIKARVAYLSKVADVIDAASDVVEDLQAIDASLQTLLENIEAMYSLLNDPTDNIVTIYADAFELVLRDHAGEDISAADIREVDEGLARVNTTISGLSTAGADFYAKVQSFDPSDLLEKIEALRAEDGAGAALNDAISAHERDSEGDSTDAENARDEYEESEALMDKIQDALDAFSGDLMTSVETRVTDFQTDLKAALELKVPNFSRINSYASFKSFGRDYLADYLDQVEEGTDGAIQAAIDGVKADFQAAFETLKTEIANDVRDFVKEEVKAALDTLKDELGALFADEVSGPGLEILGELFSILRDKFSAYTAIIDDLSTQTASSYLGGGDAIETERPSAGAVLDEGKDTGDFAAVEDKDKLASETDDVLAGIIQLVSKVGELLENLRDAVLITEYVTGQFTYSTIEHDEDSQDGGPMRLTRSAFADCWTEACAVEAEYILTGMNSATGAYGLVFLIRLAANMITAFRDPLVNGIRAAISLAPIVGAALAFVVPVVAAVMQSADDMIKLHAGEKVPLYSHRLEVLTGGDFKDYLDDFTPVDDGREPKEGPELSYKNYLSIFLIVTTFVAPDGVVQRAGDIIQFNKGYLGDEGFRLADAHTAFTVSAEYEMKPLVSTFFTQDPGGALFSGDSATRRLTTVGGF